MEFKETTTREGKSKYEIIKEVSEVTGLKRAVVKDVLNAFTDVAIREMVVTGVFKWPNLPIVTRKVSGPTKRYQKDLDKTLLYPETAQLRARMPQLIKGLHREAQRQANNEKNGVSQEDWWKPYYYCDGDWREKGKEKKKD